MTASAPRSRFGSVLPWHPALRSRRVYVATAVLAAAVAGSTFVAAREPGIRVPDLSGEHLSAATHELDDRGLDVETTYVDDPGSHRGTILGQVPAAGTHADGSAVVTLTVASGRVGLGARRVVGESYSQAARDLVALGLVPVRVSRTQAQDAGSVVAVGPTGRLPVGSSVTLTVAVPPLAPTAPMRPVGR